MATSSSNAANNSKNLDLSILLVEDRINERNTLNLRFRGLGIVVDAATSGMHAINLLENRNYQLVIMCAYMEDMSCLEILALIRHLNPKEKLPVVLRISPNQQLELIENNLNADLIMAQANSTIDPSCNFKQLLDHIRKIIN